VQVFCPAPQGKLTSDNRDSPAKLRFDVVAVEGSPSGVYGLEWVKDAFRA